MMNILPDPLPSTLDAVVGLWTCYSHVAFILPVNWVNQAWNSRQNDHRSGWNDMCPINMPMISLCFFSIWYFIVNTCCVFFISLRWRHNERDGVSSHQPYDCLLNRLFRHRSKKTSKLRVTGLCVGNSPETGEFPAQMASNAENVSIWWRHHVLQGCFADTEANVPNASNGSLDYMGRNNHKYSKTECNEIQTLCIILKIGWEYRWTKPEKNMNNQDLKLRNIWKLLTTVSLQWHHMRVIAFPITINWNFCSTSYPSQHQRRYQNFTKLAFVRGTQRFTLPQKGRGVMFKGFPRYEISISYRFRYFIKPEWKKYSCVRKSSALTQLL